MAVTAGTSNETLAGQPHVQPPPSELQEMTQRASQVVRLLEELKRLSIPNDQIPKELSAPIGASDEHRPPKRPWEDVSREDGGVPSGSHRQEVYLDGLLL